MKPEAQRVAIAEACGWVAITSDMVGRWPNSQSSGDCDTIPNYLNDLNAMHEAEKTLEHMTPLYDCTLIQIISDGEFDLQKHPVASMHYVDALLGIHATAAQRAEAFLRTLNLWKDE